MPSDIYVALGPSPTAGDKKYRKLTVDALGRLISAAQPSGLRTSLDHTTLDVTNVTVALPLAPAVGRNSMEVYNLGASTIWVGNATVTADSVVGTTSGRPLASGESYALDITEDIILYARSAPATTNRVLVMEFA